VASAQHLLEALAGQAEPLGGPGLGAALAQRVLDHAPLELLDGVGERLGRSSSLPRGADALGQVLEAKRR